MKRLFIISMIICGFWCGISAQIAGNYFPKMKPVETAVFLSVGGATESAEALHACRIFQGIINRDSAELFLTTGDKEAVFESQIQTSCQWCHCNRRE